MSAKDGLDPVSIVYKKINNVFRQYDPIYILDTLGDIEGDVTIISPTVPYDVCKIISNYYNCNITVLYNNPAFDIVKDHFKNINLVKINIFTKEVNNYIKGTVILHDFQYMAPLEYLPYELTETPIIFYSGLRMVCDEEINQNFKR